MVSASQGSKFGFSVYPPIVIVTSMMGIHDKGDNGSLEEIDVAEDVAVAEDIDVAEDFDGAEDVDVVENIDVAEDVDDTVHDTEVAASLLLDPAVNVGVGLSPPTSSATILCVKFLKNSTSSSSGLGFLFA